MASDYLLISPGFGAGWSTWAYKSEMKAWMARYEPIVKFLQQGGEFKETGSRYSSKKDYSKPWEDFEEPGRSVLKAFCEEAKEKFDEIPYLGGARALQAVYCPEPTLIHEYDGSESLYAPQKEDYV